MPAVEIATAVGLGIVTMLGSAVISMVTGRSVNPSYYDSFRFGRFYFTYFPEEYTSIVDKLLMSNNVSKKYARPLRSRSYLDHDVPFPNILRSFVSHTAVHVNGNTVPSIGKHTCYVQALNKKKVLKERTLDLEKVSVKHPLTDKPIVIYRVKYFFKKTYHEVITVLLADIKNSIRSGPTVSTISIDTADVKVKLEIVSKIYRPPKPNQALALQQIMNTWVPTNHYNVKVVICGPRGIGKTYMGPIVKRKIDSIPNQNYCCCLYDDFNPECVGVNIKTLALQVASDLSPVILVINEIDKIFDFVVDVNKQNHDPRLQHAKDKTSFHNMLDDLGSIRNIITIFTTEKSPEELYQNEQYRSFIRTGRVDYFINMTADSSTLLVNNYF